MPDELWKAALEEAAAAGTTVTAWVNADLRRRVDAARRKRERGAG
ncbi:hypothetical protein ACH4FX_11960 [Streptomyces sp. NPDC018019]